MDKKFDVKEKIEELAERIQSDKNILDSFQKDPIRTIESLIGIDLPDDQLKPLVAGIKTKLAAAGASDLLGGIKKLF
jgi:phosphopantetheine adenylyltransferase